MAIATLVSTEVRTGQTYEVSASLLSNEPVDEQDTSSLRINASNNGRCYVHILRNLGDETYLAKVAARPEQAEVTGFTLLVTDEQMIQAQPYRHQS